MEDFYTRLGVSQDADTVQIKKAFREKVKQVHPDTIHVDEDKPKAAELFIKIKTAYDILADTNKRKEYDEQLRRQEKLQTRREKFEQAARQGKVAKDWAEIIIEFQTIMQIISNITKTP